MIIATRNDLDPSGKIWGTGGWLPPESRTALDWFCLFRFIGLEVIVREPGDYRIDDIAGQNIRWLVLACDTTSLTEDFINKLAQNLELYSITMLCTPGKRDSEFARWCGVYRAEQVYTGETVELFYPGKIRRWNCRSVLRHHSFFDNADYDILVAINGSSNILWAGRGRGKLVILADNPSDLRDQSDIITQVILHMFFYTGEVPMAWRDWSNTLILRMDDPGSSETVHNNRYTKPKLGMAEWNELNQELLHQNARMSIGYVIGWVDDGDEVLGELSIDDRPVRRTPGKVYPSPLVRYSSEAKDQVYDYTDEYNAIQHMRQSSTVEVEMHGYTHIYPDRLSWISAEDRHTNESWYREFGSDAMKFIKQNRETEHPIDASLNYFLSYFGIKPTTLISPGEVFTHEVLLKALDEGLMLVSSYYLAFRDDGRFCWSQHICAPYLDTADEKWFDGCLPVVGTFHDFDIAEHGVSWFPEQLARWKQAGAKRVIDFCEVSALLNLYTELQTEDGEITLVALSNPEYPRRKDARIILYFPDNRIPSSIRARVDNSILWLEVTRHEDYIGSVTLKP